MGLPTALPTKTPKAKGANGLKGKKAIQCKILGKKTMKKRHTRHKKGMGGSGILKNYQKKWYFCSEKGFY